ncbi:molybdate ABC transporter substrate-binding protein [Bartonella sp. HY406]|uniref:molybdate ABC transporter substrate-binding protein n=1 Tax=Bartonella sp. HY406 TaxID=2979331 RepID=UPI0021C6C228|nr:molybdate ABC transporter substrate-binding protein [Bartonella sp. HY406]UXN02979.1 molybdate ABC transporter substrate-binding protein [Bartonella sp. HY406]
MRFKLALIAALLLGSTALANAEKTSVAVAANFTDPATEISALFKEKTGHEAELAFGATGNFYNQITQGAPFDVFLAADDSRPALAVKEGYGVENSVFTYAIGTLVLWSSKPDLIKDADSLKDASINHIAFANAKAAPYGKAAIEAMEKLGVYDSLKPKLVEGQNISQTFQFAKTGNAEAGFVALSQVINEKGGSQWIVPQEYYNPIRQDAVLLKNGEKNEAAKAFIEFLKTPEAHEIIKKYGYQLD